MRRATSSAARRHQLSLRVTTFLIWQGHEAGHFFGARRHQLSLRPPLLLPSSSLGCLGGHSRLASYPTNRTALYDYAILGPLAGGAASLACFGVGLSLPAISPSLAALPQLPLSTLHLSLGASLLTELVLGAPSAADAASSIAPCIPLHPLAIAGLAGILSNALACLPVGRLDGGRAAIAAYGRRSAAALGGASLLLLGLAALISDEPSLALPAWAALCFPLFRQVCISAVSLP